MRQSRIRRTGLVLGVVALLIPASAVSGAVVPQTPQVRGPVVGDVVELGHLEQPDRGEPRFVRDGGMSGPVGGRLLWMFGDAISPRFGLVDNSAAAGPVLPVAPGSDLTATDEQTTGDGDPVPFVPMTSAERNPPPGDRFALWPGNRLVPTRDGSGDAWMFFHKIQIPRDIDSHPWWTSTGVARVHAPDATHRYPYVTRDNPVACNPRCLFEVGDRHQFNATATVRDGRVYLTNAASAGLARPLYATRASFARLDGLLTDPNATPGQIKALFRYWNGGPGADPGSWVRDIAAAASMPGFDQAWGGHHSISWNPHLGSYLAVYLDWDRKLKLRTAPTFVGPWSTPTTAYDTRPVCPDTGKLNLYSGWEHPALATENGRSTVLSFWCGDTADSPVKSQIHLLRVTFA